MHHLPADVRATDAYHREERVLLIKLLNPVRNESNLLLIEFLCFSWSLVTPMRFFNLQCGARGGFRQPVLSPFTSRTLKSNSVPARELCFLSITSLSNLFKIYCSADWRAVRGRFSLRRNMCVEWVSFETIIVERVRNISVYFIPSYFCPPFPSTHITNCINKHGLFVPRSWWVDSRCHPATISHHWKSLRFFKQPMLLCWPWRIT